MSSIPPPAWASSIQWGRRGSDLCTIHSPQRPTHYCIGCWPKTFYHRQTGEVEETNHQKLRGIHNPLRWWISVREGHRLYKHRRQWMPKQCKINQYLFFQRVGTHWTAFQQLLYWQPQYTRPCNWLSRPLDGISWSFQLVDGQQPHN